MVSRAEHDRTVACRLAHQRPEAQEERSQFLNATGVFVTSYSEQGGDWLVPPRERPGLAYPLVHGLFCTPGHFSPGLCDRQWLFPTMCP
jgi:hypothetical protein